MPQYHYTVRDFSLNKLTGEITAKDEKEAKLLLKEKDLIVLDIKEIKPKKIAKSTYPIFDSLFKPKIKMDELTLFSRQFATLIEANVQITRSLFILSENTTNRTFKKVLKDITNDIESGSPLSTALAKYNYIFPPIYIDMVSAAEIGGALPEVLDRLASYMENDKSIRGKVKSAFIYPIAVMIVAILAVILILIVVIPKFIPLFADLGEQLPLPTRMLLGMSTFMQNYWFIFLLFVVASIIGLTIYGKTKAGRRQLDFIKLRIPILGQVATKSAIARFCRTLETLQKSGVPLVQSLTIVGKTSGNVIVEEAIGKALQSLESGKTIAEPLEKTKIFPVLVTQMISIGEETGALEILLAKIADFYEEEVALAVKNMTSLIEPVITIFLGVVVGFIAVAVVMPMYNMMGALQKNM